MFFWRVCMTLLLCLCTQGKKIKRMEKFEFKKFKKYYDKKAPVIIGGLKKYIANASSEIFRACGEQQVSIRRMPSLQKDKATISLNNAIRPCGLDCYGIYKEEICKDAFLKLKLPEDVSIDEFSPITLNIAWEGIESPLWRNDEGVFHYLLAGVEEWRFLLHDAGELDLFSQDYYADKLTPHEVLYLPPATLSQHRALNRLSIALEGTQQPLRNKVEVEMVNGDILAVPRNQ